MPPSEAQLRRDLGAARCEMRHQDMQLHYLQVAVDVLSCVGFTAAVLTIVLAAVGLWR